MKFLFILPFIMFTQLSHSQNNEFKSFSSAKSALVKLYGKSGFTFYCHCPFQANSIKTKRCSINSKKYIKRKSRLEWEHVVPAHAFGHSFKQWRENKTLCRDEKGKFKTPRSCAQQDEKFVQMESDIYNLFPAVGAVNAIRNKYSMAEFNPKKKELCPGLYIEERKIMPPKHLKGDIARVYMYMDTTYPNRGIISGKNKKLFEAWDVLDPVSKEECELVRLKQKFQKNTNEIVLSRCQKQSL